MRKIGFVGPGIMGGTAAANEAFARAKGQGLGDEDFPALFRVTGS